MARLHTVPGDLAMLVLGNSKERGPFDQVFKVEPRVIIFGEWIEIGEISFKEILWLKSTHGRHDEVDG